MVAAHRFDLLTNSVSYFREAAKYIQVNSVETNNWKFGIVHVVQALELALKERLRRVHPVLVYESVDRSEKTVSLLGALERLRNPRIGNLPISDAEANKIQKASQLRNELTHFEFNHEHEHIEAKFAEVFSFMIFFYREHLGLDTDAFIDEDAHQKITQIVRARAELLERSRAYLSGRPDADVWMCPNCNEDTFVVDDCQCCLCHHKEAVLECPTCSARTLENRLIDLAILFDWDESEGRSYLIDDFDVPHEACEECLQSAMDRIREARFDRDYERQMRDFE